MCCLSAMCAAKINKSEYLRVFFAEIAPRKGKNFQQRVNTAANSHFLTAKS